MKWHHSLYWRIALGFVGALALLLFVQALLFVWVLARSDSSVPNQPPERFAQTVAVDVGAALERDPSLDVADYVRTEYGAAQPFFVVMREGDPIEIGGPFADGLVRDARARLQGILANPRRGDRFERGPRSDGPRGDGPPDGLPGGRLGRSGPGLPPPEPFGFGGRGRAVRPGRIVANGELLGLVIVPPRPPFGFLLAGYGPTLAVVAAATLIVGALLAAVAIFGPARSRLRALEEAAQRLGSGDLTARAPAHGRDEVAAVARAFNAMADDLAARAEALAASDRTRRQLLADVSHELNTPVTAMRGYIETLSMPEMPLDPETRTRYLRIVGDETARLERIIGDLLDLARLDSGGGGLRLEDVPVEMLFARVKARHDRELTDAGVTMRIDISPDGGTVRGDRDRLEQALQNLAANALRYAPRGSEIVLASHREDGHMVLSVTDAGAGIPPEHLAHVFDRFYKTDVSRSVRAGATGGGSGLGLSIVKAIVERHRGTVSVRSEPGQTVFELRIEN
jgi:signal transduction histidine kinase